MRRCCSEVSSDSVFLSGSAGSHRRSSRRRGSDQAPGAVEHGFLQRTWSPAKRGLCLRRREIALLAKARHCCPQLLVEEGRHPNKKVRDPTGRNLAGCIAETGPQEGCEIRHPAEASSRDK